jgi:[CysO sulfur-carrier protein]-S-L-cysteine hydrolase
MASVDAYKANEKELFDAIRKMREKGEEMVGLYHSHTGDQPEPSDRDKELNYFPNHFYFIISIPPEGEPNLHCYTMSEEGVFSPITII